MYQHPRPSPRSASAANNLQTNPTRTNNQRHSSGADFDFDTYPSSDRGTDDAADDMAARPDQSPETDPRQHHKINQVIQVRTRSVVVQTSMC